MRDIRAINPIFRIVSSERWTRIFNVTSRRSFIVLVGKSWDSMAFYGDRVAFAAVHFVVSVTQITVAMAVGTVGVTFFCVMT